MSIRSRCYAAFTQRVGPNNVKDILGLHRMLQLVRRGQERSVSECEAEFKNAKTKLTEMVSFYRDLDFTGCSCHAYCR